VSPTCHPLHGFESGGGLLRHWKWIGLRAPGPIIHHKGMHESSLGEPVLGIAVYGEGMLMRQFVFDFDGHDLVKESLRAIIPLPMFLHESIEAFPISSAPGENQNVTLGFIPFRLTCLVKGLDHCFIVSLAVFPCM
jgi:hypothetical protein